MVDVRASLQSSHAVPSIRRGSSVITGSERDTLTIRFYSNPRSLSQKDLGIAIDKETGRKMKEGFTTGRKMLYIKSWVDSDRG